MRVVWTYKAWFVVLKELFSGAQRFLF